MSKNQGKTPKRRKRRLLKTLVVLLLLVVVLVGIAPALINAGLGREFIRSSIEKQVNGTVRLAGLHLGWLGPQSVKGLQVVDRDGRTAVDANVEVNAGLLKLVTGSLAPLEIVVGGRVKGEIRKDGSISLTELAVTPSPKSGPAAPSTTPAAPAAMPDFGPIKIRLDDVEVEIHDAVSGRDLTVQHLNGQFSYAPGGSTLLKLHGDTKSGLLNGSIDVDAESVFLFDESGALAPDKATLRAELKLASVPVLYQEIDSRVDQLTLSATSEKLTDAVAISLDADAVVGSAAPSRLEGRLVVDQPMLPSGALSLSPDRVTGSLKGQRVPSALLQVALAAAGLDANRDIGPVLDIDCAFAPGQVRDFTLALVAEKIDVDVRGRIDTGDRSMELTRSRLAATVSPGLVAALTPLRIDEATPLLVLIDHASLPADFAGEGASLGKIAMRVGIQLDGPVSVRRAETAEEGTAATAPLLATFEQMACLLETEGLSQGAHLTGSGRIDSAALSLDQQITRLLDVEGKLTPLDARVTGTSGLTGLRASTLSRFLPERAAAIESLFDKPIDCSLAFGVRDERQTVEAVVTKSGRPAPMLQVAAVEMPDFLRVETATFQNDMNPALFEALQSEKEKTERIVLDRPAELRLVLQPFDLPGNRSSGFEMPTSPLAARVEADEIVLSQVPALAQSIGARQFAATVSITLPKDADPAYTVTGSTALFAPSAASLGALNFEASSDGSAQSSMPSAHLVLTNVLVAGWERVLGKDAGSLSRWTGDEGDLEIDVQPVAKETRATLKSDFPALSGTVTATMDEEVVRVDSQALALRISEQSLDDFLRGGSPKAGAAPPSFKAMAPLPLTVSLSETQLPLAMLRDEAFDPSRARIDVKLQGGPLRILYQDKAESALQNINAALTSSNLAQGVGIVMTAESRSGSDAETGTVDVTGRLSNLLSAAGTLDTTNAALELDAKVAGLPTGIVDALADYQGLLVDALGPTIDAEFKADRLSRTSGTLDASIRSAHGSLVAAATAEDDTLQMAGDRSGRAQLELTPSLGKRLLYKIHPIFADIRSTEQPLKATMTNVTAPLDGDVSKLSADLEITLGAIELDSGSALYQLLSFFQASPQATVPGFIEPVKARIRNGVVTYDRFVVKIDKYSMAYQGTIDLNTKAVNLRTEIPLDGLAKSVKEIQQYAGNATVPLMHRGTLGNIKTELDLESLVGQGLKGTLNEVGKKQGIPIGDILDTVFGGPKKKDEPAPPKPDEPPAPKEQAPPAPKGGG